MNSIESYLTKRGRSASSLLTAWQESGDRSYYEETLLRFPDDPLPHFVALLYRALNDQRHENLNQLKRTDPNNLLVNCLAAYHAFIDGRSAEAVAELIDAASKSEFRTYQSELDSEWMALLDSVRVRTGGGTFRFVWRNAFCILSRILGCSNG